MVGQSTSGRKYRYKIALSALVEVHILESFPDSVRAAELLGGVKHVHSELPKGRDGVRG